MVKPGLGEPYGGTLVDLLLPEGKVEEKSNEARGMIKISPFIDFVYDAEKIGIGSYTPLQGFMDQETLKSVLTENKLPDGLPWTMPIILAPSGEQNRESLREIREGEDAVLLDWNGDSFAILHVTEKFSYSKEEFSMGVYGTTDVDHPNVNDVYNNYGDTALAGKISLIRKLSLPTGRFELTPRETREAFRKKGWHNVVAYQCRNPPHTAHEYIQRCALEIADIDGLFIQPVVGRLKKGDYKPEIILEAYKAIVDKYYPKQRVMLTSLSITMRYAGPKAALFYAIVRKNYGATHYIVGRDQAGVGNYYGPYACHRIFDRYDVGVIPLRYTETFYCRSCRWMATEKTCPHSTKDHVSTSQTRIRQLLKDGKELPREILRPEVAAILSRGDVIQT